MWINCFHLNLRIIITLENGFEISTVGKHQTQGQVVVFNLKTKHKYNRFQLDLRCQQLSIIGFYLNLRIVITLQQGFKIRSRAYVTGGGFQLQNKTQLYIGFSWIPDTSGWPSRWSIISCLN